MISNSTTAMTTKVEAGIEISGDFYKFQLYVYGMIIPVIGIFGILATGVSALVFVGRIQRMMRRANRGITGHGSESLNALLLGLTISDCVLLVAILCIFPWFPYCEYLKFSTSCAVINYSLRYVVPICHIAQSCSVWICVAIAVDRYIAVVHPLKSLQWCTLKQALITQITIVVCAVVYRIPTMLEWKVDDEGYAVPTDLHKSPIYFALYYFWSYGILMFAVPWLAMIWLNVVVYKRISHVFSQRRMMNNDPKCMQKTSSAVMHESRRTKLAMMVCVTFVAFNIVSVMANVLISFLSPMTSNILTHIGILLVTINSATNFIIYCAMGRDFRARFARILLPCFQRKVDKHFGRAMNSTLLNTNASKMPPSDEQGSFGRTRDVTSQSPFHKQQYPSVRSHRELCKPSVIEVPAAKRGLSLNYSCNLKALSEGRIGQYQEPRRGDGPISPNSAKSLMVNVKRLNSERAVLLAEIV